MEEENGQQSNEIMQPLNDYGAEVASVLKVLTRRR